MTGEEWLTTLTLPYEDVPEGPEGKIDGALVVVEHGVGRAVTVNVYDSDDYRANVTPYWIGACRIIENETGKKPVTLVSRFDGPDGHGIEIVVVPHPEDAEEAHYTG